MKINEVKTGQIFAIEGAKSYPKLKLDTGYIDMRNEILFKHNEVLKPLEVQLMTNSEIRMLFKRCGMSTKDWKDLRKRLLEKVQSPERKKQVRN